MVYGDEMPDNWEQNYNGHIELSPISTSPLRPDTDFDRVPDGCELWANNKTTASGGAYPVFTNPLDRDTDDADGTKFRQPDEGKALVKDSIEDGAEDKNYNGLVDWIDYNDDDSLNDGYRLSWSGPLVNESAEQSDLNDNGWENEIVTELIETDPLDQDSDEAGGTIRFRLAVECTALDKHGITEREEVRGFGTDPLLTDSDHDMNWWGAAPAVKIDPKGRCVFDGTEVGRFVNMLAEVYNIPQDTIFYGGSMAHNPSAANGDQYIYGDHDSANKPTIPVCMDSDEDDIYDGFDDDDEDRIYEPEQDETGEDFNCNGRRN